MSIAAWIGLRIVYAWMFLWPVKSLIANWEGTVQCTQLLMKKNSTCWAITSVVGMVLAGIMILIGFWGQIAAIFLFVFNIGGAMVHYRLAAQAQEALGCAGQESEWAQLAVVGHTTSASVAPQRRADFTCSFN